MITLIMKCIFVEFFEENSMCRYNYQLYYQIVFLDRSCLKFLGGWYCSFRDLCKKRFYSYNGEYIVEMIVVVCLVVLSSEFS